MPDNNLTKNDELTPEEIREVNSDTPDPEKQQSLEKTEKEIARMDLDSDDDNKLPIDDELIKVEDSPYDEFIAGDRKTFDDPDTELPKTDISEEIVPHDYDNEQISDNLDSTSKIYTLPDHAVSSSEKKELLDKLHTKIPGIIQHQNGDTVEELQEQQEHCSACSPTSDRHVKKRMSIKSNRSHPVEEKTEIFAPPEDLKDTKPESKYCDLRGNKIIFDKSVKLRVGEHIEYLGKKYGIKRRLVNKSVYLKYGLVGIVCTFVAILLLVSAHIRQWQWQVGGFIGQFRDSGGGRQRPDYY